MFVEWSESESRARVGVCAQKHIETEYSICTYVRWSHVFLTCSARVAFRTPAHKRPPRMHL